MLCAFKEGQDTFQVSDAIHAEQATSCGSMNMEKKFFINYFVLL
jgi:hypothetical protein